MRSSPCPGFSLLEVLVVISIVIVLAAMLLPLVAMLRESARVQQATSMVEQLHMAIKMYASEDLQRRLPPEESDLFIRYDRVGGPPRLINQLENMGLSGNLQKLIPDPSGSAGISLLLDPWNRPYRYQPDAPPADPSAVGTSVRPDPQRTDWNARNQVPYDYVYSLGKIMSGHPFQLQGDPDATPPDPNWIYVHTAISSSGSP
jgi:prepilin-type N-terminal cleavage/methylation domain-containing protein